MYLPYIRGKKFELIGIRNLITGKVLNSNKVSPIIEPVKNSSTLGVTLRELIENNINFTVVVNPQVGQFTDTDTIFNNKNKQGHHELIALLQKYKDYIPELTIIHNAILDGISDILALYEEHFKVRYNVINLSATSKRYHQNFKENTRVELNDYFNAQPRNSDYLQIDESDFSEEYRYYKEDGFIGFSDYLSIGEEYSEAGFLPYAVAIHLSYEDKNKKKIKIKHFVSDSNDDPSDIAGKFAEALKKLIDWCKKTKYESIAIPIFKEYYETKHFPGLGTLKKLSLMNHIDLVLKLI